MADRNEWGTEEGGLTPDSPPCGRFQAEDEVAGCSWKFRREGLSAGTVRDPGTSGQIKRTFSGIEASTAQQRTRSTARHHGQILPIPDVLRLFLSARRASAAAGLDRGCAAQTAATPEILKIPYGFGPRRDIVALQEVPFGAAAVLACSRLLDDT
jgi:hypothetical protein